MKLLNTAMTILFAASMLASCGGKDKKEGDKIEPETKKETVSSDNGPDSKLEGSWEIKRAEGDMASYNTGTVYKFEGSKLSFGKDGYLNPGSTIVSDSTFSFQADGNELKFMYNYRFNGDTMVVTMVNGTDQVFHMVKQ